jgi:hypothetical protein
MSYLILGTFSCAPAERHANELKKDDPQIQFKGKDSSNPESTSIPRATQMQVEKLLGNYTGTVRVQGIPSAYILSLTIEDVRVEGRDLKYAKMNFQANLVSGPVSMISYLATQSGSVNGRAAMAFTSVVVSIPNLAPQNAAFFLVLATDASGNFSTQGSSVHLVDCGFTTGAACVSNTPVSQTSFASDLRRL